jgi:hypothetical protein
MPRPFNNNGAGRSHGREVRRERFSDGSEIVEFESGTMLVIESNLAKHALGKEQPTSYGASASADLEIKGE